MSTYRATNGPMRASRPASAARVARINENSPRPRIVNPMLEASRLPNSLRRAAIVPATATWFLKFTNGAGSADLAFNFGASNPNLIPVTGDWNGDGVTTIGFFDPATAAFFLRDSNDAGPATTVVTFGAGGTGLIPIVGDWNNDGIDTIGVYNPASATFFLRDSNTPGGATYAFTFGAPGMQPLAGVLGLSASQAVTTSPS